MYRAEYTIVPEFTTASRLVVSDGFGLFISHTCPKCHGDGRVTYSVHGLSHWSNASYEDRCDGCDGEGAVHEQTDEDELNEQIERVAA